MVVVGNVQKVRTVHILLVDDVNLMCQFLNETLRVIPGVECHTASRVSTADTLLQRYDMELAIIDLNLPDGSGLEIVKQIRKGECKGSHDIPVLIFSGNTYKEAVKECLMFQVSDIMAKPIVALELRKRVQNHLNKKANINTAEHFQELDKKLREANPPKEVKVKSSVVKNEPSEQTKARKQLESADSEAVNQFIKWPSDATTGFHQIDRRLKDLCFQLNHFHFYRTDKETYPTAKEDIKQIRMCLDDLNYAIKPIKASNPDLAIWKPFSERIKMISELPFDKYSTPKLALQGKGQFSKSLRTAWMGILTKPIIQRKK
ncbi:response regulator [Psychrosphaera haliotis]|uniref:Response regulator n=1 Tax=Psychrosphaera haliotis TaxID=555083 RepID=A0A6N8FBF8_9GAMM|nr:response regulator [Psychrosphaera haliotis]MUH71711.1 response regulator [Psychrosphaera haliotis]